VFPAPDQRDRAGTHRHLWETLRDERPAPVPGGIAYLWTTGNTGTYSLLINPQPGLMCMIDAGQSDRLKEVEA